MKEQISDCKEEFKKSEEIASFFQTITENASDGVVVLDYNQKYTYISPNAYKMFGYDPSEKPNLNPYELTHPDDLEFVESEINKTIQNPEYIPTLEYRYLKKSGEWLWLESKFSNLFSNPNINGFVINFKDISERKANLERLKYISDLQAVVIDIGSKFMNSSLTDVDNQINSALEVLGRFVEADRIYIFSYDFELKQAINTYEWCSNNVEPQIQNLQNVPFEVMGYWPEKHAKGEIIEIPDMDFEENEDVKKALSEQGIKSLIAFPILQNNSCIGFAGIDSVNKMRIFDQNILIVFKLFLQQLSDYFKKLNAESLLKINEARYRLTQEVGGVGSWEYSISKKKYWNSYQFRKLFGIVDETITDLDEIHRLVQSAICNPKPVDKALTDLINDEKPYDLDFEIIRLNDGEKRVLYSHAQLVFDLENNETIVRGIVRDITTRLNREQKLKQSEALLAATLRHGRFSIWSVDLNQKLIYINETFTDEMFHFFGIKLEVGMELLKVLPQQMHALWLDRYERTFANQSFIEEDVIDLNDRKVYIEVSSTPIIVDGEVVGASFYGEDITDRKETELRIKNSEELATDAAQKFDKIFRKNPLIMALADIDSRKYIDVNDTFLKLLEYEKDEVIGKTPFELGIVYDMDVFNKGKKIVEDTHALDNFEMNIKTKTGKILTGLTSRQFIENQGKVYSLIVVVDVTDRKVVEEKLVQNTQNLNILLQSMQQFIKSKSIEVDYNEITKALSRISGAKYVILNKYSVDYSKAISIYGHENIRETILKFLKIDIFNHKWKRNEAFENLWSRNKLTDLPNFESIFLEDIQPAFFQLINGVSNLGEVTIVRIDGNNRIVGNIILVFEKGKIINNAELIEMLSFQLGQYFERLNAEEALLKKINEMERFHKLTINRELNMIDLKKEVNELLNKMGQEDRYRIVG